MPDRFTRRWLAYDEHRPTRPRLAKRFVIALLTMLILAGLFAMLTAR